MPDEGLISIEGAALFREALDRIDGDPTLWDQRTFGYETRCGTVACVAGHIIMAAGGRLTSLAVYVMQDGEETSAERLARQLLGIDIPTANVLFETSNTREDLDLMLKSLVSGERLRSPW